jgi:hypothetical protein
MEKYNFYSDPGHAWLEVPIAELKKLGIEKEISGFSYKKGYMAYLEEDCDATAFIKAKEKAEDKPFLKDRIREVYQENTPIRDYRHFHS